MACRTIADVEAAADAIEEEPLSQEAADRIAAILLAVHVPEAAESP